MWKIKFFLLVEAILGTLALLTMLADDLSRFLILFLLFLFLFYYFRREEANKFLLVAVFFIFFFVTMLNPYVIAGVVFAIVYTFLLFLPYLDRKNPNTFLQFSDTADIKTGKNRWWGDIHHFSQERCQFDDINLVRLSGRDTIHLEGVVLSNHDNVILIRKMFGDTRIVVPVDVAVSLQYSSLYGQVTFFGAPPISLRNEYISKKSWDYNRANKSVKIVISSFVGNVEVVRV